MVEDARKNQLLETLERRGGKSGNKALRDALGWSEEEYWPVQRALVREGRIEKRPGRGGAVSLLDRTRDGGTGQESVASGQPRGQENRAHTSAAEGGGSVTYGSYQHDEQATLRPDVGIQDQFRQAREPRTYRYDSSLSPELAWDENAEREFADWLLSLVTEAGEKGEEAVFSEPQKWKGTSETFHSSRECAARLKSLTQPFLNWAGKAERQQISVPTVPLFVHERHSTRAILEKLQSYKAAGQNLELFGDPQADIADKLDAYEHTGPWTNRMILGDSLQVMNSLLGYEGMGGQIQMVYIDPPYGVKFGSNFQPFVRKREVTHGKDEEMIREPEMVKAYRDTWELGLHSYLSYLRDRLLLVRELLNESGSVFVQISNDHVHHVREVLDETFGASNFVTEILYQKTTGAGSPGQLSAPPEVGDYILWYAKDVEKKKFNRLYKEKTFGGEGTSAYRNLELADGHRMTISQYERENGVEFDYDERPEGSRVYALDNLTSQAGSQAARFPVSINGQQYTISTGSWKTSQEGMQRLIDNNRVDVTSTGGIGYVRYFDDFPFLPITSLWTDTVGQNQFGQSGKVYVVQTAMKAIERCILMSSDPGDLVMDITCGSGTTALSAEEWGRRWIMCESSRVPLALSRQRLLTTTFRWYELANPERGPSGGFWYSQKRNRSGVHVGGRLPHITLQSIARGEEPPEEIIVDRPDTNQQVTRVCGPFAVEATIQAAATLDETAAEETAGSNAGCENPRAYLDRMIEVLRRAHNLQLPGNESLSLDNVRPLAECEWLHAEAQTDGNGEAGQRIAIAFGPEDGAIHSQQVYEAAREAYFLKYDRLYLFGFAIQAKARELVEDRPKLRIPCTYVNVTPDVVMADLLKTSRTDQIFSVTGLPDVQLKPAGQRDDGEPLYQTEVRGLDIFRPDNLETESVAAENLPCWMLDTDYNGMVFCASQVFFPRTGAWDNLKKSLKAEFDDSVWEHLAGTESEPFALGDNRRIAVKVIDERGNELMVVRDEMEAGDE